jgi:prephenate dehydrogenase
LSLKSVLILGAAGAFGRLFNSLLAQEGYSITGIDSAPIDGKVEGIFDGFVVADLLTSPSQEVIAATRQADWVLSCMPQDATLFALESLAPHMQRGSLFMDMLSVKASISLLMQVVRDDVEFLSIHPMFAPSVGFRLQNVVIIRVKEGAHCQAMVSLLAKWGARLHYLTAEQHDRSTAAVQVATHAAVISFGIALNAMSYNVADALPISSPPHRTLLALLARIVNGSPEVYWQIQAENPFAPDVRSAILTACRDLQSIISDGNAIEFSRRLTGVREMLGGANEQLLEFAGRSFALTLPD